MSVRYTLRQLEAFAAVADQGSIVRAADRLGLSASAVTAALNDFEASMGTQLTLRRRARGITLTPAGELASGLARELLDHAQDLQDGLGQQGSQLRGRISVGCYVSLAPTLLVDLMARFSRAHPAVEVDFRAGSQLEITAGVLEGRLDLGIAYDVVLPPELRRLTLTSMVPAAVMAPGHSLADAHPLTLERLAGEKQILLDISPSRENTLTLFAQAHLTPRIAHRTTDFEVTRSMVARGMGFAILAQRPASDVTYLGEPLLVRSVEPGLPSIDVVLIAAPGRRPSQAARAFRDLALSHASEEGSSGEPWAAVSDR